MGKNKRVPNAKSYRKRVRLVRELHEAMARGDEKKEKERQLKKLVRRRQFLRGTVT